MWATQCVAPTKHVARMSVSDIRERQTRVAPRSSCETSTKAYGTVKAVDDVSLDIGAGEFVTLLGPSGSGKTTMLMVIAGFEPPTRGEILIGGRDVTAVPPHKREHRHGVPALRAVSAHDGVREHRLSAAHARHAAARDRRASGSSEALDHGAARAATASASRASSPAASSSASRWRARSSIDPPLLLMDEPLGALDKKLREEMQLEIKRCSASSAPRSSTSRTTRTRRSPVRPHRGDERRAPRAGRHAARALREPGDAFVAGFIGEMNFLAGRCRVATAGDAATVELPGGEVVDAVQGTVAARRGDAVVVLIRPEDIAVERTSQAAESRNTVTATLRDIAYHGDTFKLEVLVGSTARQSIQHDRNAP